VRQNKYRLRRAFTLQAWKRIAAALLLFSFALSPLSAFAQIADQGTEIQPATNSAPEETLIAVPLTDPTLSGNPSNEISPQEQETSDTQPPVNPESEPEDTSEPTEQDLEPEPQAATGSSETQAGAIFINNETTRSQIPEVNTQTGSLNYQYEITVPPGRNNLTPNLLLEYDSNETSNTSVFGYGWTLSTPHIKRLSKTGVDRLYASSTIFHSSLDGELVQVGTSTSYRPRVENGDFRQYTLINNGWTILSKDGSRMSLGSTTASRRDNPASSTQVFSWYLDELRDSNNNYIKYTYYKDAGQIYPDVITYTGNGSTDGIFTVGFTRESRGDNLVQMDTGFTSTTTYRISRIEGSINGSWVERYDLGYSSGHNGNRSLLASIARSGRDEAGTVTSLPSTNFTYETYSGSGKSWSEDTNWVVPVNIAREEVGYDDGARFVDINGDSLIDIIQSRYTEFNPNVSPNITQNVYLNTGTGWATSTAWTIPKPYNGRFGFSGGYIQGTGQATMDMGARFADVNKDGFTDILWSYYTSGSYFPVVSYNYSIREVYLSNGTSTWATSTVWTLPQDIEFAHDAEDSGGRVVDINGDGLPDLLSSVGSTSKVYINTGAGWQAAASSTWQIPEPFSESGGGPTGTEIVDVNGDGLVDIFRSFESDRTGGGGLSDVHKVYINTGSGWSLSNWTTPLNFLYQDSSNGAIHSPSTRFIDVNGDSLTDLISSASNSSPVPEPNTVYVNTGEGWTQDSGWSGNPIFKFGYNLGGFHYTEAGTAQMDVDGDNAIDFVRSGPSGLSPAPHVKEVFIHQGKVPDLLSQIEYPEGGKIILGYEQSARYTSSGSSTNPRFPFNLNTVNTVTYNDSVNSAYTQTYMYGGGELYYASSTDNQPAGFATTTKQDSRGNKEYIYISQANATNTLQGEHADAHEKIGKPYLIEKYDASNNLYDRISQKWESQAVGSTTRFVYKTQEITQRYDGDSDHKDTAITYSYDAFGNVLTQNEWGEVTSSTTGSFIDIGSDKRVTTNQYASSTNPYIVSLPSQSTITDQSSIKVRENKYYYDNQAQGALTAGNLTRQEDWISSSTYAVNKWTYNSYGLKTQEVNPRNATTTYSYDSYNLYPVLTTNPLNHTSSSTYDYSAGKPKLTVDANGKTYQWTYDGLDRVLTEGKPDPNSGALATKKTNTYIDSRNAFSVLVTSHLTASSSVPTYQYFDGYGRKIQERARSEEANTYAVRDWVYGKDGFLIKETLPYSRTGSGSSNASSTRHLNTTYSYDVLGRRLEVGTIVGTTTTIYDQWEETVTDPLGKYKIFKYDAYSNLRGVDERNGGSTYSTTYGWNLNNQLTTITDALGNTRTFTYDGLNRRLAAQDLHAAADGTFGTWQYQYDDAGNLTQTTDPKSQIIQNTYDLLNRQQTENYTGQVGTEITYTYDSCSNGIGRLCTASSTAASTTYTYTPDGLIDSESRKISGTTYVTNYDYDLQGNKTQITYPDSSAVRYLYNAAGQLESIDQKESGAAFSPIVTDFDYNPANLVSYQANANCTYLENTYNTNVLYRLTRKKVGFYDCDGEGLLSVQNQELSQSSLLPEVNSSGYFDDQGQLIGASSTPETLAVQKETIQNASTGTTTPAFVTPEAMAFVEAAATSTEPINKLKQLPVDDPQLKFKRPSSQQLGIKVTDGIVRYAYRTDMLLDSVSVAEPTIKQAQKAGVAIATEVVEKRTKYSRTFSTDKRGVYVLEVVSGDPRYYKDENGVWWLAAYGETTKESYDYQLELERKDREKEKPKLRDIVSGVLDLFTVQRAYAISSTFYPDPNSEVTSVDGEMYKDNSTNWSTVRNATASNWGSDSNADLGILDQLGNGNGSSYYGIRRAFLLFDTSAIPDGATVSTTTLDVYITDVQAAGNEKRMYVVSSNPASNTALSTADYDLVGGTSYGVSDGTYTLNTYESIPLNSSGIAAISKTGISKFALRTHNDFSNVTSTNSNELNIGFSASETSGTGQDPRLVVIYNTTPSAATSLLAEGQTNPTGVPDQTPSLSSVYIDPDPSDQATHYQIQVSTSNTDWTTPVWDSGKQALPNGNVSNGYRSPDIEYGGTALLPATTYYWRMKFWDLEDAAGSWSTTTASFSVVPPQQPLFDSLYKYDAVGNIVNIVDIKNVDAPVAQVYTYDDLYRLVSVATTTAILENQGQTVTVQPDASTGKDTHWGDVYTQSGGPDWDIMRIGGWSDNYYSYIEFSLGSVPSASDIEYALLHLYNNKSTAANDAKLERITQSWTEAGVTSSNNPTATDIGMAWQSVPNNDWWIVDVTDLVKSWKDGTYTNHGVKIIARYNSGTDYTKDFISSENTDAAKRPKLVVKETGDPLGPPLFTLGTTTSTTSAYTYDVLGNIVSNSLVGSYSYAGTGYSNPHALTSIGSTTYTYDNNGNLTGYTGGNSLSWDYKNRMSSLTIGSQSASYGYDHTTQRVLKTVGAVATKYPNTFYETTGATTTKHIYAGDTLIASVNGIGTSTASTTFAHLDHLGSTRAVTGNLGQLLQSTDYHPFGSEKTNVASTSLQQFNRYISQDFDAESAFSYLNARYYDGQRGQFINQDPSFQALGDSGKIKELTQLSLGDVLRDPQNLNSYAYARNNPIINKDPSGNWYVEVSGGPDFIVVGISGGIRFDENGAELFGSVSGGLMASLPVQASFSSGELTHEPRLTVSRNAEWAAIAGAGISREGDFNSQQPLSLGNNPQNSYSVIAGAGAELSQAYTVSAPISTPSIWRTNSNTNSTNTTNNQNNLTIAGPNSNTKESQSRSSRIINFITQQFYNN
jgi:RHS repeat-associated protein